MLSSNQIIAYVQNKYNERKKEYLTQNNTDHLTPDAGKAINDALIKELTAIFKSEKPAINPKVILDYYGGRVKGLKRLSGKQPERISKRNFACALYAEALVKSLCYRENYEDEYVSSRSEKTVPLFLNPEERPAYTDCFKRINPKYYEGKNLSQEEIEKSIDAAKEEKNLTNFRVIKSVVDTHYTFFAKEFNDNELITQYPNIVDACNLITEGITILEEIKKNKPEEITNAELKEYEKKIYNMMSNASKYIKRMALMTSSFYPYINLEALFDASASEIIDLGEHVSEKEMSEDENVKVEIDVATSDKNYDEVRQDNNNNLSKSGFGTKIHSWENILILPNDVMFAQSNAFEAKITSLLGMNMTDIKKTKQFRDKNGNLIDLSGATLPLKALVANGGEFYIFDKYGDHDPVPVVLDKTAKSFSVLVGRKEVAARIKSADAKPSISWFKKAANNFYSFFTLGGKTAAMKKYLAAKETYDLMSLLDKGKLPQNIKQLAAPTKIAKLKLKENRENREKIINGLLESIHIIPDDDISAFDNALGTLLANKGLNSKIPGKFRHTIYKMLNVFDANFNESKAIDIELKSKDQFREFVWKLRNTKHELLKDLKSDQKDIANKALKNIIKEFTNEFNEDNPWNKPVSKEYLDYKKAQQELLMASNKAIPGKILTANQKASLEFGRDNEDYWDSIKAIYGSQRPHKLDWMPETSGRSIISMHEWNKMRKSDVDLNDYKINDEVLDEKTFAALNMMLSLRDLSFFTAKNFKQLEPDEKCPNTVSFEDIVSSDRPRPNTRIILDAIVEPTRQSLLHNLKNFDTMQINKNGLTGRKNLAADLAKVLKLYALRVGKFGWMDRKNAALTMVADKVLQFANNNDMMDDIKKNGLTKEELDLIYTTSAIGQLTNEAFNAEADLKLAANGDKNLNKEQRLECINKILRLNALQADLKAREKDPVFPPQRKLVKGRKESHEDFVKRQNAEIARYNNECNEILSNVVVEYGDLEEDLKNDQLLVNELAYRIMPMNKRTKLADKSANEILEEIKCVDHTSTGIWGAKIKNDLSNESIYRTQVRLNNDRLKTRLKDLEKKTGFEKVVETGKKAIANHDMKSAELLLKIPDEKLKECNEHLTNHNKDDVEQQLKEFVIDKNANKKQMNAKNKIEKSEIDAKNQKQIQIV